MSTATIIAFISSALHDAELSMDDHDHLTLCLRFLKTFLLCGKKLCSNSSFKLFLVRIEENFGRYAAELHILCGSEGDDAPLVPESFSEFTGSLWEEMDKWYATMLDHTCSSNSTSLTSNVIYEIIASVLESMVTFSEEMNPLKVQLIFLKSLIPFVTRGSTEAREDLMVHSETLVINTAYVLFRGLYIYSNEYSDELFEEMLSALPKLVRRMKPVDFQVYQIYTQSLIASNMSKLLLDDGALLAVENFLDALKSYLKQIIWLEPLDTCHMGWMKDQLQELYTGLRSLGIVVKQQPLASFDMEIQNEIADVVTDVGISICSSYQAHAYVYHEHQHLLDKFNIVLSKISKMNSQLPIFKSPRTSTSSYGFVDCILETLMELTSSVAESTFKSRVQTIQVGLASVRASLEKLADLRDEHVELQTLWDRLLEVAFKVENFIDYQVVSHLSDSFSTSFDSIMKDIANIKSDVLKIEVKEVQSGSFSHLLSQRTPSTSNEIIGFKQEEKEVLDRLRLGSKHLKIIAIVGMPGLGKTTLAKKVYNHSSISQYFSAMAWCPISQVLDKKSVFFGLLKQISPIDSSEMSEHDLADRLRRSLKGRRYLIFLDDIWNTEAWNDLKHAFPNDTVRSRIIFTSRSLDVAPREMLDQEPLVLRPLSKEESLKLTCIKLFPGQGYDLPPAFYDLGMQIVTKCRGLPLAIIVVSGVLENAETKAWEGIRSSFNFLSSEDNCRYTLDFSYRHLPDFLKPCFLYFGAFLEDEEVSVWRLLLLWISEGFVRKSETSRVEDVAEDYLSMLISRSLIMTATKTSDGRVKTCRIHDLIRDFCLEKAKDEHFFHFAKDSDELYSLNEPPNLRRLIIDVKPGLRESNLYCPHARSLLLRSYELSDQGMSSMLQFFQLLKVLDLGQLYVGEKIPCAIQHFALLTFLAIGGGNFTFPSWLAYL